MEYIYCRVSTDKQENENQSYHLRAQYPNAQVFEEVITGTSTQKPVLTALLALLRDGDTLVIAALDRLGRRAGKAITLIEELYERGIKVISIRENIDYSTPTGKLIGQITLAVSENERNLISERTKATLSRLKAEGKVLGRPREDHSETIAMLLEYRRQGKTIKQINELTQISTGRICQLLKAASVPA